MNTTLLTIVNKFGSKIKKRFLGIVLILPMAVILLTSSYFYCQIQENKDVMQQTVFSLKESQADILTATVSETFKRSKLQTELIRSRIVNELENVYGSNVTDMKRDYLSHNANTPFYQIISNNIATKYLNKDYSKDRIFVANREGILIDNSLEYHNNSFISWDDYISSSNSHNKEMITKTIESLSLQNSSTAMWIESNTQIESIPMKNDGDLFPVEEFIHYMCNNKQLEALKGYSILSVSYVFDHEDIFGVPDIVAGKFTKNDKLYIIQVFNIGDLIESIPELQSTLQYYDHQINHKEKVGKKTVAYDTLIMILIIFLELSTFIGTWYLVEFYINNRSLVLYQEKKHEE